MSKERRIAFEMTERYRDPNAPRWEIRRDNALAAIAHTVSHAALLAEMSEAGEELFPPNTTRQTIILVFDPYEHPMLLKPGKLYRWSAEEVEE